MRALVLSCIALVAVALGGCAMVVAPDAADRPGASDASARRAASSDGGAPFDASSASSAADDFCAPPPALTLSPNACRRRVTIVELHAVGCWDLALTGELRFPCEGGPAILDFGDATLYGFVHGDEVQLCGARDFVLHPSETCEDGPDRMRGAESVIGPLSGPLSVMWRAVSLSHDARCAERSCSGAGIAHVEER